MLLICLPRARAEPWLEGFCWGAGSSLKKDLPELRCWMLIRKHLFDRKLVTWFTSGALEAAWLAAFLLAGEVGPDAPVL